MPSGSSISSGSAMSCSVRRKRGSSINSSRLPMAPVLRLSMQSTEWPRRNSRSQRCEPRNPAPPATTIGEALMVLTDIAPFPRLDMTSALSNFHAQLRRVRNITARHARAEFGELRDVARRTRVMRLQPAALRREAEGRRDGEFLERRHLPVEPLDRSRTQAVGPTQSGAQMPDAELAQPAHGLIQAMVLEMKPLTYAEVGRVVREAVRRGLRRAVLAQQSHVEVPVVGGSFRLAMARGGRPGARQIVEAVPVDALGSAAQQLRGALEAEFLHFVGAEGGHADLGDPHRERGDRADFRDLRRPFVDVP